MQRVWIIALLLFVELFNLNAQNKLAKAQSLAVEEKYEQADQLYQEIYVELLSSQNYDSLLFIGLEHADIQGTYEDVRDVLQVVIDSMELEKIDSLLVLAEVHHQLAIAHYQIDDYRPAITNWQKAIEYRRGLLSPNDSLIAKARRNIGNSFYALGYYSKAEEYLREALDSYESNVETKNTRLVEIRTDLGYVLCELEDFDHAKQVLDTALFLSKELEDLDIKLTERIYGCFHDFYAGQRNWEALLIKDKEALEFYNGFVGVEETTPDLLANAYNNLGIVYEVLDSLILAIENYEKSIRFNQEVEGREFFLAGNYTNLSIVYRKLGDYDKGHLWVDKAIEIDELNGLPVSLEAHYDNKGAIFFTQEEFDAAIAYYQKALTVSVPSFQSETDYDLPPIDKFIIGSRPKFAELLHDKAKALYQKYLTQGDQKALRSSIATYDAIRILINQIRRNFQSDKSKTFLVDKAHQIFETAIKVNLTAYEIDRNSSSLTKIFQLIEQSKATIVLDAFSEQAANRVGIPESLVKEEKELLRKIKELEGVIQKEEDNSTKVELTELNQRLQKVKKQLLEDYPKYAILRYGASEYHLSDIKLESEQTAINYFVGKEMIYAFVTNKNGSEIIKIPLDFSLTDLVKEFRTSVEAWEANEVKAEENMLIFQEVSYQLYQKLVLPIQNVYPLSEKLLIIPDGILGYLPFDIFLVQAAIPNSITQSYMIHEHEISYAYSITLLNEVKAQKNPKIKPLIFALDFEESEQHDPIPTSIQEGESVYGLIGGDFFQNGEATKDRFLDICKNYSLIHFSSHAKANDELADSSYIAFAEKSDTPDAEKLYLSKIYALPLQANMVYLSACETSAGELKNGEGILSLARGFTYAGAKSIITTLWSVDGGSTKKITEQFYTYLKDGYSKSTALRQAKLDYINDPKNIDVMQPYYWAAAIPVGDMAAITSSRSNKWWYFLLAGFLLLFIGAGVKKLL